MNVLVKNKKNFSQKKLLGEKFKSINLNCIRCSGQFRGNRYQRWCDKCRRFLNNFYWEGIDE